MRYKFRRLDTLLDTFASAKQLLFCIQDVCDCKKHQSTDIRRVTSCKYMQILQDPRMDNKVLVGFIQTGQRTGKPSGTGSLFPVSLSLWFWASSAFPPSCLPSSTLPSCERHNTTAHPRPTPWPLSSSTLPQLAIHTEILQGWGN